MQFGNPEVLSFAVASLRPPCAHRYLASRCRVAVSLMLWATFYRAQSTSGDFLEPSMHGLKSKDGEWARRTSVRVIHTKFQFTCATKAYQPHYARFVNRTFSSSRPLPGQISELEKRSLNVDDANIALAGVLHPKMRQHFMSEDPVVRLCLWSVHNNMFKVFPRTQVHCCRYTGGCFNL